MLDTWWSNSTMSLHKKKYYFCLQKSILVVRKYSAKFTSDSLMSIATDPLTFLAISRLSSSRILPRQVWWQACRRNASERFFSGCPTPKTSKRPDGRAAPWTTSPERRESGGSLCRPTSASNRCVVLSNNFCGPEVDSGKNVLDWSTLCEWFWQGQNQYYL